MIELSRLPDCPRAVRLFLDRVPQSAEGPGLRLARAVEKACAEMTRDPRTAGPDVVLANVLSGPHLDEAELLNATRVSAAWAQHWAVRGILTGSWQTVGERDALVFRSEDGENVAKAHLRVRRMSDPTNEVIVVFRVGRMPTEEREQTAVAAQLEVIRAAAPTARPRQVFLSGLVEISPPADVTAAAYARAVASGAARRAACDLNALTPPRVEQPACKRCRMQEACAR